MRIERIIIVLSIAAQENRTLYEWVRTSFNRRFQQTKGNACYTYLVKQWNHCGP